MRLNRRPRVLARRRYVWAAAAGLGLLALIVGTPRLCAQEFPAAAVPTNDADTSGNQPLVPANQPTTEYSPAVPDAGTDQSQLPGEQSQTPSPNSATAASPLTPNQGANLFSNYSSPFNPAQQSLLVVPQLYSTGAFDLNQIAANAALASAFTQGTAATMFGQNLLSSEYAPIQRIRLGPVDIKTSLSTSVIADDNINATSSNRKGDFIFTLAPAVLVQYGNHEGQRGYASLVYAPTFTRYYHESAQDTNDDESVALNVQYPFQRLTLGGTQTLSQVTGINLDSQARTTQTTAVSSISASYEVDDRISANASADYAQSSFSTPGGSGSSSRTSGSGGNNDTSVGGNVGFSYRLSDKINFGPSASYGLDSPDGGGQETYEQGLLGISYKITEKISLNGQAGIELRQYGGSEGGSGTSPIFSGGVNYTPTENMGMSLSGFRNVQASSGNYAQNDTSTGVSFTVAQKLFQRFNVSLNFNYEDTEYTSSGNHATVRTTPVIVTGPTVNGPVVINPNGGSQTNYAFRPTVSYSPTEWTSVELYYQWREDDTEAKGQSYTDDQAGMSFSAQF